MLFLGIFLTMIPALELLRLRGGELGVRDAVAVLLGDGRAVVVPRQRADLSDVPRPRPGPAASATRWWACPHAILAAISVGAVAMGANTYIGNAPNFMVKSIAEEAGVRMPSFFGYMLYSGLVLIPLFVCVTFLFFAEPRSAAALLLLAVLLLERAPPRPDRPAWWCRPAPCPRRCRAAGGA